jgi:uncharacterized protein (TIGR03437 family)
MKAIWNSFAILLAVAAFVFGPWPAGSSAAIHDDDNKAEISGPIISLPGTEGFIGTWQVGKTKVNVTRETKIDQSRGRVTVGAWVEVEGTKANDGSINAAEVKVRFSTPPGLAIKFSGKIEELPSTPNRVGDWKVSGKTIHVTATTKIEQERGQVGVGVFVEIEGLLQTDGSITALEIEVKPDGVSGIPVKFLGRVEMLPTATDRIGDWVISGRKVKVTANTRIKQDRFTLMVGSLVEVSGVVQTDGSIVATEIEVKGNIDNPTLFVNFRGVIEMLPNTTTFIGDWKVSGRTVKVTDQTRLDQERGKIVVGAYVEVKGTLNTDGSVGAQKIEVRSAPNPPGYIKFIGKVTALPSTANLVGDWKVNDRVVHVSADTKIEQEKGRVAIGSLVEVEGILRDDRSVDAKEIEVKHSANDTSNYIRFYGTISTLPATNGLIGDWVVGGKTVHVVKRTRIRTEHGTPRVGAYVEVEGNLRADNSVDAYVIEVERDAAAPAGTIGFIDFYGQIKGLPTAANFIGEWMVGPKTVAVTADTKIETRRGQVAVNAFVEVKGYLLANGSVTALKIEVRPAPSDPNANVNRSYVEFIGTVSKLPDTTNYVGDWTVGGKTVHVKERTVIKRERAAVTVGATVEVYGAELADGSVDAKFIEVEHGPAGASFVAFAPVTSVNAGSYLTGSSSSSIVAAFGANMASRVETAKSLPLPTTLGGVSVLVDGNPAGLFFVSPNQINYQAPDRLLPGSAQVAVMRDGQVIAQGSLELESVAPSLFTADSSGRGLPAGILLRVRANGQQVYEPLTRSAITRQNGDRLFLVLFGSGLRGGGDTDGNSANGFAENLQVTIGNVNASVVFAGEAPGFAGLDQCNIEIPANAKGSNLSVTIKVSDGEGKLMRANSTTISVQ